jgi:cation transport regulator ChaC
MSPIWVFKYGSLILNPGIADNALVIDFIGDYHHVFY